MAYMIRSSALWDTGRTPPDSKVYRAILLSKINENDESLIWSRFKSDKVDCLHLLPSVIHALQFSPLLE